MNVADQTFASRKPTLIGYFPKKMVARPEWVEGPQVELVCSVSEHISSGPGDWINEWRHNEWWVFDSQEIAESVVPTDDKQHFETVAYAKFPFQIAGGKQEVINLSNCQPVPLSFEYVSIGFDAVSRSQDNVFECSPLSCNNQAKDFCVNRWCLLKSAEEAFKAALRFDTEPAEPGPYYVVEVFRKQQYLKSNYETPLDRRLPRLHDPTQTRPIA